MPDTRHTATRRRVSRRLLPYLCLLYFIAYLDRTNIGIASLQMTKELGFSNEVYGFGAGIFFAGYFLLEIPGTLLVERWSARKWISRIMISWGLVAVLTGFMRTEMEFYWLRFFLGLAEAGFFPGVLVYLTHWFLAEDRARTNAMFVVAIPLATVFGSPISGWRWLLILEGIPAIVLGIVTVYFLTDRPRDATWLPEDERDWLEAELARERSVAAHHGVGALKAMGDWRILALTAAYTLLLTGTYGVTFWLPKFLAQFSGFSNGVVSLLVALPYLSAAVAAVSAGILADRRGNQRLFAIVGMCGAGILWATSQTPGLGVAATIFIFMCAQALYMSAFPNFWALPTKLLTGNAAAASVGLISSFGSFGGFVGPYAVGYFSSHSGGYPAAFLFLGGCAAMGGALVWLSGFRMARNVRSPARE